MDTELLRYGINSVGSKEFSERYGMRYSIQDTVSICFALLLVVRHHCALLSFLFHLFDFLFPDRVKDCFKEAYNILRPTAEKIYVYIYIYTYVNISVHSYIYIYIYILFFYLLLVPIQVNNSIHN